MTTTAEFLRKVKSTALVPTHQITFQDTDILDLANEEMDNLIVPFIMSFREEFFVTKTTLPMVIGEDLIEIPERAVGRTIRELKVLQNGKSEPYSLSRASITESYAFSTQPGQPQYHYFEGDSIFINPIPDQVYGEYHLWWEIRPSRLCLATEVGIITSITANTIVVQQNLTKNITTGSVVDIVKAKSGYSAAYNDIVVSTISTGIGPKVLALTGFSVSNPITGVKVGDHVSLAFTSDIIQLPDEAVACLVQATALRLLQGQSMSEQFKLTKAMLDRNMESLQAALTPRNEGASFKIRPRNPLFGPGKRTGFFR